MRRVRYTTSICPIHTNYSNASSKIPLSNNIILNYKCKLNSNNRLEYTEPINILGKGKPIVTNVQFDSERRRRGINRHRERGKGKRERKRKRRRLEAYRGKINMYLFIWSWNSSIKHWFNFKMFEVSFSLALLFLIHFAALVIYSGFILNHWIQPCNFETTPKEWRNTF